jgi:hypothetical protein
MASSMASSMASGVGVTPGTPGSIGLWVSVGGLGDWLSGVQLDPWLQGVQLSDAVSVEEALLEGEEFGVQGSVVAAELSDAVSSVGGALEAAENVELGDVLQGLGGLVASAWGAVTSPFAIFGPDMPLVNALFVACFALLAFGMLAKAPKQ